MPKLGAHLVGQAFVFVLEAADKGIPVHPNERILLTWMCNTAKDTDERPLYFGGREHAAMGLGRRVPGEPELDDPDRESKNQTRRNAFEVVKRATKGLVDLGAVRKVRHGKPGRNAEYAIQVNTPPRDRAARLS